MKKRFENRGQIFSADFLVAVVVALFVLTSLQVYQSRVLQDMKGEERMVFRESLVSRTDTLLLFEGEPEDWTQDTVEILGFSTGTPNKLNQTKLVEYFDMDEEEMRGLLGFAGRDSYLAVEDGGGETISADGIDLERGEEGSWENAENVYTVERRVSIDEKEGSFTLRLVVW